MIWQVDVLLFAVLIITAGLALHVRDLVTVVALLSAYSVFAAIIFAGAAAVDVAFVEAVLGAGVTGVLFIAAILMTTRRADAPESATRRLVVLPILGAFLALMVFASTDLPDRADPDAPAHHRAAAEYVERSVPDTQTPNVVTAVLADYRAQDTLGETLVIVTAALAASLVLRARLQDEELA